MERWSNRRLAVGFALTLFGLYMLAWNGTFHSSDGLSMYTVTDSLMRYGRIDIEQVRWMGTAQGLFGPDSLLYSNKSPLTSFLALPLAWLGLVLPGLGPVHASLLLMPLASAATGSLIYLAGRRAFPNVSRTAAALAVLAWGLGSLAWPYSKMFFAEPVVALTAAGALERLLAFCETEHAHRRERVTAFGLGLWLGLGVLSRTGHAVILPCFLAAFLYLVWKRHGRQFSRWPARTLLAFAGPVAAALGLSLWYSALRFGSPWVTGYPLAEGFGAVWWQGAAGQLVSPGRGLLWYAPWLVLIPLGLRRAWRRAPEGTAVAGAAFVSYLLFYGYWRVWSGGWCWGPRFLVPVLPLLAWLAIPAAGRWRRPFIALAFLGILVNAIGTVWHFHEQQWLLYLAGLADNFDWRTAQVPWMLWLARPDTLDVAWMVNGQVRWTTAAAAVALASTGILGACAILSPKRILQKWGTAAAGAVLLSLLYLFLWQAGTAQPEGYRQVAGTISAHDSPGTMIWHNDHWNIAAFLNLYKGRSDITGVHEPHDTLSPVTADRLSSLAGLPHPVWVVNAGPAGTRDAVDRAASAGKGAIQVWSAFAPPAGPDAPWAKAEGLKATFYFDSANWQALPVDYSAGTGGKPLVRLSSAGVTPAAAEGVIAARLVWEALEPLSEPFQAFVRLTGPDGEPVALNVSQLQNGQGQATWQPGELVPDVHAFALPEGTAETGYRFAVSIRRMTDLKYMQTPDGQEETIVCPASRPDGAL